MESKDYESKGVSPDEIALEFGNNKRLYMSRHVLFLASPVFSAMFKHDFREKREEVVKVEGDIEQFREFFQCIDPGVLKKVTGISL